MVNSPDKLPSTSVGYAEGSGLHLGDAENKSIKFHALAEQFRKPLVTRETFAEYKAMGDAQQGSLKRMPGWIIRCPVEKGKRSRDSVQPGRLITIDIDEATPGFSERLLAGDVLPGVALFAHTTRGHTPEKPRFRLFVLADSEIDADHYQRVCRITALEYDPDLKMTDKVSARPAQLMYRPSVSRNMEEHYVFYTQPGGELNWQKIVKRWERETGFDSNDITQLPRFKGEKELRESAESIEDPRAKKGPVGDWCRAYSCVDLVLGKDGEEPILGHVYEVSEWASDGIPARFSYIPGHSTNGVVIYRDGDIVYSHHGSDPATDMTLNSFDLCRIHLFDGNEDDETKPMRDRESWKKMVEFAKGHHPYQMESRRSRYEVTHALTAADLDDDDLSWVEGANADDEDLIGTVPAAEDDEDLIGEIKDWSQPQHIQSSLHDGYEPAYKRKRAKRPPEEWVVTQLDVTQEGAIKSNTPNIMTIVANDPRMHRKIAFNEFTQEEVLIADIKYASPAIANAICKNRYAGTRIEEHHHDVIKAILQGPPRSESSGNKAMVGYGLPSTSDANVSSAVRNAARLNSFNPLLDQIEIWRQMGPPEVDPIPDFLPRYFGVEKNAYSEQVARHMLVASIYRATTPGLKFDFILILKGKTGIGKSTIIRLLYGDEYFGELSAAVHDKKQVEEEIRGKWGVEMDEMDAFNKSESATMKSFLRRQNDDVRRVYDRNQSEMPRRFVVWGTLNQEVFLKDDTGNRSYWIVETGDEKADLTGFDKMRELLWRQAIYDHDRMREETPFGNLPLYLTGEAAKIAEGLQETNRIQDPWELWMDAVLVWFETPIRAGTLLAKMGIDDIDFPEDIDPDEKVLPAAINYEMAEPLLEQVSTRMNGNMQATAWQKVVAHLAGKHGFIDPRGADGKRSTTRLHGKVGKWLHHFSASSEDQQRGFRTLSGMGLTPGNTYSPEDDDLI